MIDNILSIIEACAQNTNRKHYVKGDFKQYHLHNALVLASLGYYVFPVTGDKAPYKDFHWREYSSNDPKAISQYWQQYLYGRIAIDCEKSGINVIDVDNKPENDKDGLKVLTDCLKNWGNLPKNAPVVISPSGGLHIYFKASNLDLTRCYANCIDIQRNHYVLAPTSVNRKKGMYKPFNTFLPQSDLPAIPNEWTEKLLTFKQTKAKRHYTNSQSYTKRVKDIDIAPLLEKCEFIKECVFESETLPEYLWFEFAKFLSGIANGEELFHKYSENYPAYNYDEAQSKFERAKKYHFSCQSVKHLFDGCKTCTNNKTKEVI